MIYRSICGKFFFQVEEKKRTGQDEVKGRKEKENNTW
jgi:hypothetical protein